MARLLRLHDAAGHAGQTADQEARQCGTGSCNRGITQNGAVVPPRPVDTPARHPELPSRAGPGTVAR